MYPQHSTSRGKLKYARKKHHLCGVQFSHSRNTPFHHPPRRGICCTDTGGWNKQPPTPPPPTMGVVYSAGFLLVLNNSSRIISTNTEPFHSSRMVCCEESHRSRTSSGCLHKLIVHSYSPRTPQIYQFSRNYPRKVLWGLHFLQRVGYTIRG